ncbi:hypothetical protein [Rhodopila sp.]|uniref:hypothetical protein n=1 Tax=Rhodopila sp. TaxID=2480087 RepID=UPI003D141AD6
MDAAADLRWGCDAFRDPDLALLAQVGLAGEGDNTLGIFARPAAARLAGPIITLAHEPELLLLDGPFGALDHFTREQPRQVVQTLRPEGG